MNESTTLPALAARIARREVLRTVRPADHRRDVSSDGSAPEAVLARTVQHQRIATGGHAARLTAYQRLVGESASDVLPAGYLHILGFPLSVTVLTEPSFPLPMLGMVHVANEATVLAPVRLGDELDVRVHAAHLQGHHRGTQVDLMTDIDRDGLPVYRGISTYLAQGVTVPGVAPPAPRAPREAGTPTPAPMPTAHWAFTTRGNREYAALSGDHNPIHSSAILARAFGFRRRIAHGMHTAARALAACSQRPPAYRWSVTFGKPVLVPGTVDVTVDRSGSEWRVVAYRRDGIPHATVVVAPADTEM